MRLAEGEARAQRFDFVQRQRVVQQRGDACRGEVFAQRVAPVGLDRLTRKVSLLSKLVSPRTWTVTVVEEVFAGMVRGPDPLT